MYKIYILNSDYNEWRWYDENNLELTDTVLPNPLVNKLFNNDVVNINGELIFSQIRTDKYIAGILLLGKTYGRNSKNKLLYKCVPNDPKIPAFLVPYEIIQSGFSKTIHNKFVLFKFIEWTDKHPMGQLINTIGDITELSAYYEYQLYCKNLCISIKKFTNEVNIKMKKCSEKEFINSIILNNKNISSRVENYIFTIDPKSSTDLDDAIGIKHNKLSVYIANVPILIEFYKLWNSFSDRISTIYLPDRKRPMLPTLLSENLCSLLENENRFVFAMDIELNDNLDDIRSISFNNAYIRIAKNYRYDDSDEYLQNEDYCKIFNICCKLCKKYKYIKEIKDSHDLIAFLMIMMNFECAKIMINYEEGIYRTLKVKECNESLENNNIPLDVYNFIKIWQSSSGKYTNFINRETHDLMAPSIEEYLHITSPIRRLVDILNMMKLQSLLKLNELSESGKLFYNNWLQKLEYINTTMRSIRKVQQDCNILHICSNDESIMEEIYDGYVFDKIDWGNQFIQYTVYIPKIKIISRINIKKNFDDYSCFKFKLYLIQDGVTLKKKIRVELIDEK